MRPLILAAVCAACLSSPCGCLAPASGGRGSRQEARAAANMDFPAEFPSTFSIAGYDPETGDLGVAVQSRFFAVGAVVPWVEAGVGAIATQAYANTTYGPRGLALLREGLTPGEAASRLTESDPERESRQIGIVDARGRTASFTGKKCIEWAGSRSGENFAAQGNILVSEATVDEMARAFREGKGDLAERLMAAMEAGQRAGGDSRGRQSAAITVVRKNAGYGGFSDRYVDLRVDDHRDPIGELRRLVDLAAGKDPISRSRRLEHQEHLEDALRTLREAAIRYPDWDAVRFEAARLLFKAGRGDDALSELRSAVACSPGYDHHHFRAAQILAVAGLVEESLKEVSKTLVLNPEYRRVFEREAASESSHFHAFKEKLESLLRS